MPDRPRAWIAGLGLIGGSVGIALRRAGWHVAYSDPRVTLEDARRTGAADERAESNPGADLAILATPLDVALHLLGTQVAGLPTTSVASVMRPLRDAAGNAPFVAGHPLAGSHERGLGAARGDLFRGCAWFIDRRDELVERMIGDCGARTEVVTAGEHDAAVAMTSHLPQILSTALAAHLEREGFDERFAGSGLKTFVRLAGSDASVWIPVLESNREAIAPHADAVAKIVRAILEGDARAFDDAQRVWSRLR